MATGAALLAAAALVGAFLTTDDPRTRYIEVEVERRIDERRAWTRDVPNDRAVVDRDWARRGVADAKLPKRTSVEDALVARDGSIVLLTTRSSSVDDGATRRWHARLVRLAPDGRRDTDWGSAGVRVDVPGDGSRSIRRAWTLEQLGDGSFVVAGGDVHDGRLLAVTRLDRFGADGAWERDIGRGSLPTESPIRPEDLDYARSRPAIAEPVAAFGRDLVLVASNSSSDRPRLLALDANGRPSPALDGTAKLDLVPPRDILNGDVAAVSVATGARGIVVSVCGSQRQRTTGALLRLDRRGRPDSGFGPGGWVATPVCGVVGLRDEGIVEVSSGAGFERFSATGMSMVMTGTVGHGPAWGEVPSDVVWNGSSFAQVDAGDGSPRGTRISPKPRSYTLDRVDTAGVDLGTSTLQIREEALVFGFTNIDEVPVWSIAPVDDEHAFVVLSRTPEGWIVVRVRRNGDYHAPVILN